MTEQLYCGCGLPTNDKKPFCLVCNKMNDTQRFDRWEEQGLLCGEMSEYPQSYTLQEFKDYKEIETEASEVIEDHLREQLCPKPISWIELIAYGVIGGSLFVIIVALLS